MRIVVIRWFLNMLLLKCTIEIIKKNNIYGNMRKVSKQYGYYISLQIK